MDIKFVANEVSYRDAMDGDIKQLSFAEDEDDDPLNPSKYYLQLSVNNELYCLFYLLLKTHDKITLTGYQNTHELAIVFLEKPEVLKPFLEE